MWSNSWQREKFTQRPANPEVLFNARGLQLHLLLDLKSWDPSQDADGNPNSGSLRVVVNFNAAFGTTNQPGLVRDFISPGTNLSSYWHVQADVKVAFGSPVSAASDGGNGFFQIGISNLGIINFVQQYAANLYSSNGWFHIDVPLVLPIDQAQAFVFALWGGPNQYLTGTTTFWVDNLIIEEFPLPRLQASMLAASGGIQLSFLGDSAATYSIQVSTNLTGANSWTVLDHLTQVSPGVFQYVDLGTSNSPARFYRVRHP